MEAGDEVADPKACGQPAGKYTRTNKTSKEAKLKEALTGCWILGDQNQMVAIILPCALVGPQGLGREQAAEGWAGK